jgi:hypothetical protein
LRLVVARGLCYFLGWGRDGFPFVTGLGRAQWRRLLVSGGRIRPATHHVGFYARAIGLIKLAKCGRLRLLRNAPQQIRHDAAEVLAKGTARAPGGD